MASQSLDNGRRATGLVSFPPFDKAIRQGVRRLLKSATPLVREDVLDCERKNESKQLMCRIWRRGLLLSYIMSYRVEVAGFK